MAAGMSRWHERSDPRSKKSGIDTLHGDILAVVRHVFFLLKEVGVDWCKGTFGRRWCFLEGCLEILLREALAERKGERIGRE